jgi:hypothetical protein
LVVFSTLIPDPSGSWVWRCLVESRMGAVA